MSLRDVLIWSSIGILIIPAVTLARWRAITARKLVDRLVSDLRAKGEQPTEKDRKVFVAQLMLSGWKTRALTLRIQGASIPDTYLREWACFERRRKRLTLVVIVVGVVVLVTLKTLFLSQ